MSEGRYPLEGVKVVELASFIAAPASATVLSDFGSDFGAEVVKVEPPGAGDPYRRSGELPGMPACPLPYPWLLTSRNKKSLAPDLRVAEARGVMERLLVRADVFVTNLAPESLAKLALGYRDLAEPHPRLIYASFTGYGEVGEEANRPGYDVNAWWARPGMMDLFRSPEGPPPLSLPGVGDQCSALALFGAIILGLYRREKTGRGAHVRSSLMGNGVWAKAIQVQAMLCGASVAPRPSREKAPNALANRYRAKDGRWFPLTLLQHERDWTRLLSAIGREDLAGDPRFMTPERRIAHAEELVRLLDEVFATRPWSARPRRAQSRDASRAGLRRRRDRGAPGPRGHRRVAVNARDGAIRTPASG